MTKRSFEKIYPSTKYWHENVVDFISIFLSSQKYEIQTEYPARVFKQGRILNRKIDVVGFEKKGVDRRGCFGTPHKDTYYAFEVEASWATRRLSDTIDRLLYLPLCPHRLAQMREQETGKWFRTMEVENNVAKYLSTNYRQFRNKDEAMKTLYEKDLFLMRFLIVPDGDSKIIASQLLNDLYIQENPFQSKSPIFVMSTSELFAYLYFPLGQYVPKKQQSRHIPNILSGFKNTSLRHY